MRGDVFVDSNVFLYAIADEAAEKGVRAAAWLRYLASSGRGVANLQVFNEVTNVLIKRARLGPEQAFSTVDGYASFGVAPIDGETVAAARLLHFRHSYSWWDCVLLAAAIELGCRSFLTEDLQDGHKVSGLTIINPFRHTPPEIPFH